MKPLYVIFCILLSAFSFAQNADSLHVSALGNRLQEYYKAIERESLDVQKGECDFLIESTSDSLLRQFIALDIYDHYQNSPIMGSENVAVYVYDKWFGTGKVRMRNETDSIAAKVYADFNRQSLIGKKAPDMMLKTYDGRSLDVFGQDDAVGRYRILYFYDADCSKCKLETVLLNNLLGSEKYPVDLLAVYVGSDRAKWTEYLNERWKMSAALHLWDPALDSDFQRKYGVLKTPRMFLISPDGVILGRGLDTEALNTMLDGIFTEKQLEYGGPESETLFDGIFSASAGMPSEGEVKGISDYIHDKTLARGDTLMFRQLAGDYLYYLASRSGEGFKEGLNYHLDNKILSRGDVWKSSDDTLKIIGFASIMKDLLSKAAVGTRIPHIKVPAESYTPRKAKEKKIYLDRLKGKENIIIFYTEGCEVCVSEKEAALKLMRESDGINVLMVNFDNIIATDSSLASNLLDSFDLSSLPFIMITDSSGTVLRRYFSILTK